MFGSQKSLTHARCTLHVVVVVVFLALISVFYNMLITHASEKQRTVKNRRYRKTLLKKVHTIIHYLSGDLLSLNENFRNFLGIGFISAAFCPEQRLVIEPINRWQLKINLSFWPKVLAKV